jgi:lipopolysaccharide transport system permease protein
MEEVNQTYQADWDLEIDAKKPQRGLAFKSLLAHKDLIALIVRRDIVSRYKQTLLGPLWLVIQPIIKVAIFYFVFGRVLGISTDGIPPILFYLSGLTFWEFFAENVKRISGSLLVNQQLLSKVYFHRLVIPVSAVLSNAIQFAVQFGLLGVVWLYYYFTGVVSPNYTLMALPLFILVIGLLGAGLGMILASVSTIIRDLRFVVDAGLQVLFYLTPVIYPLSVAGSFSSLIFWLNPMAVVLEAIKFGLLGVGSFNTTALLVFGLVSILFFVIGASVFQRFTQNFVDRV